MIRTVRHGLVALAITLAPAQLVLAAEISEAEIEELLTATDDAQRGESSVAVIEMHVKTQRYERTMSMKAWSKGTEKSLIRILSPSKDAGVSTLKVDDNLWNYLPKVDRTMKVPAGMMSGSWMGSHMSNDDLVKDSRLSEDFTWTVDTQPNGGEGSWQVTLVPKADAAVVWGKVVLRAHADKRPIDITYYDEKGALVRTMAFGDYRDVDGRQVPFEVQLTPADKPGEFTKITYRELSFDADVPDSTFSLQSLKK